MNQLSLVEVANFQLTKQVRNCRCDNAVHDCNSREYIRRRATYVTMEVNVLDGRYIARVNLAE